MNINDLSTQLLYTTVPIIGQTNSGICSGTGFIFSFSEGKDNSKTIPLLITNHHVLKDVEHGFVEFNLQENDLPSKTKTAKVDFDKTAIDNSKLGELDLVAIPIASALEGMQSKGMKPFYRSIDSGIIPSQEVVDDLAAIETITFIGYPSGLYDNYNKSSIIRQGITATPIWNNFSGQPTFLVDAGVFPGSSGSPVFIYNQGSYPTKDGIAIGSRILFVGIITSTVLREGKDYLDLGVAVNSLTFYEELKQYISKLLYPNKN